MNSLSTRQLSLPAIALLVLALALSVAIIPTNYQEPGALFWPALSLSIGLLLIPILRIRLSDTRTLLCSENLVLVGLVYWILMDPLQVSYPLTSTEVVDVEFTFLTVVVMAIGVWIGLAMPAWRVPKPIMSALTLQLGPRQIFVAIWICFALGSFYYFYESGFSLGEILSGLMASRWEAPWSRGQIGGWSSFLEHMTYFGYVLPCLTVLLALTSPPPRWVRLSVIISICLSLIFVAFLVQAGGRRIVGVVVGAGLLTWVAMQPKMMVKHLIIGVSIIVMILYGLQGILYARQFGLEAAIEGDIPEWKQTTYFHVDDNFLRLTQITRLIPEEFDYVGLQPFLYVLSRPIPRVFWPGKPSGPGYDLPTMIGLEGSSGTSLATSIVGELYASGGLWAILLGGIFYGMLASMWNRVLYQAATPNSRALYGLGIMVLFAGLRSMQDLLLMSYGILGWTLLSVLFRKFRGRAVPSLSPNR